MLALGGCVAGGGDGEDTGGDRGSSRRDFQKAGVRFARCMRENGVDVPDPKAGEGGFVVGPRDEARRPSPSTERARRRCGKILESVRPPELSDEQEVDLREAALKHSRCMREHGVDLPDPRFDRGGVSVRVPEGFDPTSPAVRNAERRCRRFQPEFGAR